MNRHEKECAISAVLCSAENLEICPRKHGSHCKLYGKCRIEEKTDEQLDYILSPVNKCIYLEACAGSGKTEVLGMKAAYEISRWQSDATGIAVLTFTNDATNTISERISLFYKQQVPSRHFVGTFSSFVHGHIAQRFGYKFYFPEAEMDDKSFRIVGTDVSQYQNQWLQNFELDFPLPNNSIYANQLIYLSRSKEWIIGQGENSITVEELYNSAKMQALLASIRQKSGKHDLFQYEYFFKKINECKLNYLKSGFANFEDMNLIAIRCLRNSEICRAIAKKFPLILVDECQDLSANELILLGLLIDAGVVVHYIGDLHQSIYSFKDARPEYFSEHISTRDFNKMCLVDNFRSTQSIVDVSRNIAAITTCIRGQITSRYDADCFYIEYTSERDAIIQFQELLNERSVQIEKSVVLTRNQALKAKLTTDASGSLEKYPLICAIQLWKRSSAEECLTALKLLGRQLQKWIGFQGRSNNYYYPEALYQDSISWRLMLRDILAELANKESISNMTGKTYSAWLSANKKLVVSILNKHLGSKIGIELDATASFIRAAQGTGSENIGSIIQADSVGLRVETVHAVKGRTFDATLLISTPDSRGKTGYWESWLTHTEEAARIAYVACTRPQNLLCWGVYTLADDQRSKLESIGFRRYEKTPTAN